MGRAYLIAVQGILNATWRRKRSLSNDMGTFAADVRYAFRTLGHNRGFTAIALAALALGIGANTAIFTVVNRVLLRPLPYPQPDRIMQVMRQYPGEGYGTSVSIPKFMTWRQNEMFESFTTYIETTTGVNVGAGDRPEHAKSMRVSDEYFRVFG